MNLADAIAVFDKSADAQTEAWAVIRAELMRVMGAPVGRFEDVTNGVSYVRWLDGSVVDYEGLDGQRVRLVEEPTNGD